MATILQSVNFNTLIGVIVECFFFLKRTVNRKRNLSACLYISKNNIYIYIYYVNE